MTTQAKPDYRAFTIKHDSRALLITTSVHLTAAFDPRYPPDPLPRIDCVALWDTGSTVSLVTEAVVKALNLMPVRQLNIRHADGVSTTPTYRVNLFLPNKVMMVAVEVGQFAAKRDFDVVIGMDVITRGDFALTNVNGQTWMSFRCPSVESIDYEAEAHRA